MGSSGIPINIGSYCSDFVIVDPVPQTYVGCFRRIDSATNRIYYLILNQSSGFQEVEHPIIQPSTGRAYILDDFQLNVHWDRTIKPVVENSIITPQNILRYVSSNSRPTPSASNIIKFDLDSLTLRTDSNPTTTRGVLSLFPFSSVSSGQYTVTYSSSECPYTLEKGSLVYLVNDDDDNKSIITATTQKRYLIIAPPKPITIGELNLFKPEVTESMVKQTMYRINKQTSLADGITVRYSFDVFRENTQGNTPTEISTNTYREIGLTYPEFTIDPNDVRGTTGDGFKDTKITRTMQDGTIVKYVSTPEVMDKTLADLYGELSLGLFKLWKNNADTDMYLGYDCNTPGLTCSGNRQLVIRKYFNYLKPSASCQFRMYDLGNNEYMILVTDPFSNPPARFIMRPDSNGALQFVNPTSSLTKEERGWHLEPVNNPVQGDNSRLVRLRWNYPSSPLPGAAVGTPGIYISVDTNNAVSASLQASASTFVCIRCTRIDEETGTCASNQPMYVDQDLDYLTSPVLVSPTAINVARTTATAIESNLRFSRTSDGQLMKVTDDGSVSFVNDGTESTFFTTRAGIITYEEQKVPKNYVFVAKQTANSQYIYAKYVAGSPPNLKFVAATNPNVADGFGWIIDGDTIAAAPTTSPAPRSPQTIGLTILRHFRASFGSYDVENDDYTVTFNSNKNFSSITQGAGGNLRSITWSATTGSALVRATAPRSPVTSPPSFPQNTKSFTVSATFDDGTNTSLNLIVPEPPKPEITRTAVIDGVGSYGLDITNLVISNMNSSATVTVRLRAIGSPGSASPSFQAGGSSTYGDFLRASGFSISGLTPNTRYSAPSFTIVNSRNQNPISFTMTDNFTTSPLPVVVLSPTVLITSYSQTSITYTTSNSPTTVTGFFGTSSNGPWTQITSSSSPVRLSTGTSFPTTSSTVSISISQSSSVQTFYFKLDATNTAGTNSATTSSALSVPASPSATGGGSTFNGFTRSTAGTGYVSVSASAAGVPHTNGTQFNNILITTGPGNQNYIVFSTNTSDTTVANRIKPTGFVAGTALKFNKANGQPIVAVVNTDVGRDGYLIVTFYNTNRQVEQQPVGQPQATNSQVEFGTFTPQN